jgi:hypothetical protein
MGPRRPWRPELKWPKAGARRVAPGLHSPGSMTNMGALSIVKQDLQLVDLSAERPRARTSTERVGAFELRLTYNNQGKLVAAVHHDMWLTLASDDSCGERRSSDGWEVWCDGRVRGEWSDPSHGHDGVIDGPMGFAAWRDGCLRDLRSQVFFCCCDHGEAPTPAVAAEALRYAIAHGVLTPGCSHRAAEELTRTAAKGADAWQVANWSSYFEELGLTAYMKALKVA